MTEMPEVYVRDTNRDTTGILTSWVQLTLNQIRNDVGSWTLVTNNAEDAEALTPPTNAAGRMTGARGVIIRQGGQTIMSGWVRVSPTIDDDGSVRTWTFTGLDDTMYLQNALCWPRPGSPINAQGDGYHVLQGPASDRIRNYALANISQRQNIPGFGTGNLLGLGPNRKSRARMRNMLELAQAIAARDLNFAVRQRDDKTIFLHQWLPTDKRPESGHPNPVVFSPELGALDGWSHEFTPTEASRVIVGAGDEESDDEDAVRTFREYVGHVSESELGGVMKIEHFIDRRDLDPTEPGWEDEAQEGAIEYLAEATSRGSYTLNIDGGEYTYGVDYAVGDMVRAYIGQDTNSQPIGLVDDLIEEVTVNWSAEGEHAEVRVGAVDTESTNRPLEWGLRKLQRRVHDLETRR